MMVGVTYGDPGQSGGKLVPVGCYAKYHSTDLWCDPGWFRKAVIVTQTYRNEGLGVYQEEVKAERSEFTWYAEAN